MESMNLPNLILDGLNRLAAMEIPGSIAMLNDTTLTAISTVEKLFTSHVPSIGLCFRVAALSLCWPHSSGDQVSSRVEFIAVYTANDRFRLKKETRKRVNASQLYWEPLE